MIETDICVIGGGPAGSVTALRLAELGHRVTLVERAAFPRRHVGESLPPGILPLLEAIGMRQQVEDANFLRPRGATVRWTAPRASQKETPAAAGFQVDRGRFDQLLLAAAAARGVALLQPALVTRPTHLGDRDWRFQLHRKSSGTRSGHEQVRARFVVDASGRRSLLPTGRRYQGARTLAVYGYWRGARMSGPQTRVDVGSRQWYWGAPLPDGTFNATVFTDWKRFAGMNRRQIASAYHELLNESELLRGCLHGRLDDRPRTCDATSCLAVDVVGRDWIKVGEASFAIDPLSSQGVQAAILTAIQAAIVVNTMVSPGYDEHAARSFYQQRQVETVARHHQWATGFYRQQRLFGDTPFWLDRRAPADQLSSPTPPANPLDANPLGRLATNTRLRLSELARFADEPVIRGDYVVCVPALTHPSLDRSVAYLGDAPVGELLADIDNDIGITADQLKARWSASIPDQTSRQIIDWLWERNVLIAEPQPNA